MLTSFKSFLKKKIKERKRPEARPFVSYNYDISLARKALGKKFPKLRQIFHINKLFNEKERKIFRLSFLVFLISLIWLGLNFVNNNRIEVPKKGGKFIEASVGSPQFINPIFAVTSDVDMDISRLVFSGLMRYGKNNELMTDLAAKYEISDDKKVFTFELRKDVIWHDDQPFTAQDVVFTIETIQNNMVSSPLNISFQGVEVIAIDDYKVQFISKEPYPSLLSSLTVGILPEHIWYNVAPEQIRLAQSNIRPIGTGPFMFSRLTKDDNGHIYTYELKRFNRYYRELAYLDEFIFQFYTEYQGDAGSIQALRGKKVNSLSFVPKQLRDKVERKNINIYTLQMPQYTALFINQNNNVFLKEKSLRQALELAIDKDRILREALSGEGQVINSPILPGFLGYDSELGKKEFSPSSANDILDKTWTRVGAEEYRNLKKEKLLKEWEEKNPLTSSTLMIEQNNSTSTEKINKELEIATSSPRQQAEKEIDILLDEELSESQIFYRKNKENKFLEITIVTVGTNEYQQAAKMIAGFWQEIGVKVNIKYVSAKDISRDILKNRNYDVLLYGEIVGSDPDPYPFWHSSQAVFPGLNLSSYVNRNVDTLLEQARGMTDDLKRAEAYTKFQEILLSEVPAIFLYMPTYTYAVTDNIKGINTKKISQPADRFSDVTSWYMKTKGEWTFASKK